MVKRVESHKESEKRTCLIYARKSTDDRKEFDESGQPISSSVADQIEGCKALAKREGLTVIDVFADDGVSGRTPPAGYDDLFAADHETQAAITKMFRKVRPEFGKVCKRIEEGGIDFLLCRDTPRLARAKQGSLLLNWLPSHLKKYRTKIWSLDEGVLDPDDCNRMLMKIINDSFLDQELTRRAKFALERTTERRKQGNYLGKGFFGISLTKGVYAPIPDEAEAVRRIFALRSKGVSYYQICKTLEAEGVKMPTGKKLATNNIHIIVNRPMYAGLLNIGSREAPDYIPCKNVPVLVKKEVWLRCQEMTVRNREIYKYQPGTAGGAMLTGLLKCGECGGAMNRKSCGGTARGYESSIAQYRCSQYNAGTINCTANNGISAARLETFMSAFILLKAVTESTRAKEATEKRAELPILQKRLENLRAKRDAIITDEELDVDFIKQAGQKLSTQITALQKEINAIELLPETTNNKNLKVLDAKKMSPAEKREILRDYIDHIDINCELI